MEAPKTGEAIVGRVADLLPVGVWVASAPGGELVYSNDEFASIMGMNARSDVAAGEYAQPYGIHRRDGALYPEDQLPFFRALRERAVVLVDDIVIHRRDGRRVNIRAQARPVFDPRGEISHVVIAFIDITREVTAEEGRLESEARLLHAQKMDSIGNLAGGIAHDFNNLLSAAHVLTQMLGRTDQESARRAHLEQLEQVIASATQLTRSLLGFARRGANLTMALDLNEVARRVAEIAQRTLDKRITVDVDLAADEAWVMGDGSQLEQVLMNLVMNARDAMPSGGRLGVRTRAEGEQIVLTVTDTGTGIAPHIRARIFEPYFTTKANDERSGTGLGLATAYAIVDAHGGSIEALDAPPRGTAFRVSLPAATGAESVPRPSKPPVIARSGRGTILVVDDERLVLEASSHALRTLGYDVIPASSGTDAVEAFRTRGHQIHGILLDMVMPDMDGAMTFAALRAIDPGVRVLIATGAEVPPEADRAFSSAAGFLSKPYDLVTLSQAIAHLTSERPSVLRL